MNTETKVENWIEGKVGTILQLGGTLIAITVFVLNGNYNTELLRKDVNSNADKLVALQQEVGVMSSNHLTHIQASMEALNIQVVKIATQLEEHLKQSK